MITGYNFGTNPPTLGFDPGAGISSQISNYNDNTINVLINVVSGTPNEDVAVTVTANGYGGNQFYPGQSGVSGTSSPAYAYVSSPANAPEMTVVGWIDPNASDSKNASNIAANYPPSNSTLASDLQNHCVTAVLTWSSGTAPNIHS